MMVMMMLGAVSAGIHFGIRERGNEQEGSRTSRNVMMVFLCMCGSPRPSWGRLGHGLTRTRDVPEREKIESSRVHASSTPPPFPFPPPLLLP